MLALLSTALAGPHLLSGSYAVADPAHLDATQSAAIEAVVRQYPWAFRGLARPRVRNHVWNCGTLELTVGTELTVRCDDKPPSRFPIQSGIQSWVDPDGNPYEIEVQLTELSCSVWFRSAHGTMTWTWTHAPNGLQLGTEITSRYLPGPVQWSADYRDSLKP